MVPVQGGGWSSSGLVWGFHDLADVTTGREGGRHARLDRCSVFWQKQKCFMEQQPHLIATACSCVTPGTISWAFLSDVPPKVLAACTVAPANDDLDSLSQ